jgi:hypothetical protein
MTLWVSISTLGDYPMVDEDELANISGEIASSNKLPDTRTTKQLPKSPIPKYPRVIRFKLWRIR